MKLTQRLSFLVKAMLNDLFGEEPEPDTRKISADTATAERLTSLLDEAQLQLDTLRLELANALSHQKQIDQARQVATAKLRSIDEAVDIALKAGEEEQARKLLEQVKPAQENARELEELFGACEQRTSGLRENVTGQQERLDALRRRSLALSDRERNVAALDELFSAQQSLARQTEKLQTEFVEWEEQIARREDRLAARREWSK